MQSIQIPKASSTSGSVKHRRTRSDVSLDYTDSAKEDVQSLRESDAMVAVHEDEATTTFTHARYKPAVTNPMRCLEVGGGDSSALPVVPEERTSKQTRSFYEDQNSAVQSFCDMDKLRQEVRQGMHAEDDDGEDRPAKIAIRLSFVCNFLILAAKIVLVVRTGSVAFVASLLDSVLDLISGLTLVVTNIIVGGSDSDGKYPLGKGTFEPLGTLVFSCCMFTASFQLIQHAVDVLLRDTHEVEVDISSMAFIGAIVLSKFGLMIYCRKYRDGRPAVAALAADHRNDVASNLVGVVAAILAERFYWRIDPISAILITLYIMWVWANTGKEQIMALSGKSAPKDVLRQLTYAARHHHPDILFVDTVRAVTLGGDGYFVEVDIVLSPETPLRESHDIGESLQIVLEKLECVARAYVHIDYEFAHCPNEHR